MHARADIDMWYYTCYNMLISATRHEEVIMSDGYKKYVIDQEPEDRRLAAAALAAAKAEKERQEEAAKAEEENGN